uniref:Uncharacterized protein n=1 Tax=Anguilla anguilla TaxID=7936 RepID=A0A0E9V636_ANGAN
MFLGIALNVIVAFFVVLIFVMLNTESYPFLHAEIPII